MSLIIWGSDHDEKDNEVMPKVSGAAKGEKCLLGTATEDSGQEPGVRKPTMVMTMYTAARPSATSTSASLRACAAVR